MKQEKQGPQSTKTLSNPQNDDIGDERFPSVPNTNDITHDAVYGITSTNNKAYMDLIGRFQYFSSQGNENVLTA